MRVLAEVCLLRDSHDTLIYYVALGPRLSHEKNMLLKNLPSTCGSFHEKRITG